MARNAGHLTGVRGLTWVPLAITTAAAATACRPSRGGGATAGTIAISHAVIPSPDSPVDASAFLQIDNHGSDDTLVFAESPAANAVAVHALVAGQMQPVGPLAIPGGGSVRLEPGHDHLMLTGLRRTIAKGDTVTLTLRFSSGAQVTVKVPVLTYTDAASEFP